MLSGFNNKWLREGFVMLTTRINIVWGEIWGKQPDDSEVICCSHVPHKQSRLSTLFFRYSQCSQGLVPFSWGPANFFGMCAVRCGKVASCSLRPEHLHLERQGPVHDESPSSFFRLRPIDGNRQPSGREMCEELLRVFLGPPQSLSTLYKARDSYSNCEDSGLAPECRFARFSMMEP